MQARCVSGANQERKRGRRGLFAGPRRSCVCVLAFVFVGVAKRKRARRCGAAPDSGRSALQIRHRPARFDPAISRLQRQRRLQPGTDEDRHRQRLATGSHRSRPERAHRGARRTRTVALGQRLGVHQRGVETKRLRGRWRYRRSHDRAQCRQCSRAEPDRDVGRIERCSARARTTASPRDPSQRQARRRKFPKGSHFASLHRLQCLTTSEK